MDVPLLIQNSLAIHDAETVRKMGAMTRGWCFLARFRDWEQPFRDALMREMGMEPRRRFEDLQGDVAALVESVREAGYVPQVRIVDYNWSDRRTPEQKGRPSRKDGRLLSGVQPRSLSWEVSPCWARNSGSSSYRTPSMIL